jgi:copper chaperone CopZ
MNIESIEDDLPGINQICASYAKGQMVVEFDEALVSEVQILEAVDKRGYQASLVD